MNLRIINLNQLRNALSSWARSLSKNSKTNTKSNLTESPLFKCVENVLCTYLFVCYFQLCSRQTDGFSP